MAAWLLAAGMGCTDRLFFHPTTDPRPAGGAVPQMIPVGDGTSAETWIARSNGALARDPDLFVLQFTGNEQRAEEVSETVAAQWGDRAVEVWAVNFPGYGRSDGPVCLRQLTPMGLAVFDVLKKRSGNAPLVVGGRSLGTTVALSVASRRDAAGLVLQNPPALKQVVLRQFGWWNLWLLAGPVAASIPDELDAPETAKRVHAPAIFILADADDKVIPKYQRLVVDAYAGTSRVIHLPGGRHDTTIEAGAELQELRAGFDWLVPPKTNPTAMGDDK